MISSVAEHEDNAQILPDTEYICLVTSSCQFKVKFLFREKQLVSQDFITLYTEFWW